MLEGSRHALLALLTEQFKVDDARLLFGVELYPEDHSALHRRPSIAAVLHKHDNIISGVPKAGTKCFISPPKMPKLDLATYAEYAAKSQIPLR